MRACCDAQRPVGGADPAQAEAGAGDAGPGRGALYVIGIGPGDPGQLTREALEILERCDVLIGYETYLDLVRDLIDPRQEVIGHHMGQEADRCRQALTLASEGKRVALISSGDAGIYGMAGLVYELLHRSAVPALAEVPIRVIPGVSCINAAAALLGAPLMHDFAVISLSDLLTPWEEIERRLELAGQGDFVVVLMNPKSQGRCEQIERAREILLRHRVETTPVGIVRNVGRNGQSIVLTDLGHLGEHEIDMVTTVIVGKGDTFRLGEALVTPRGYLRKRDPGE